MTKSDGLHKEGGTWDLVQIQSNKNDKTKLTPLPVDPQELYCNLTPVMLAHFFCVLLNFCARVFPAKYET